MQQKKDGGQTAVEQKPLIHVCPNKAHEFAKKIGKEADVVLAHIREFSKFIEERWRENRGVMFVRAGAHSFPISWLFVDCAVSLFKSVIHHLKKGYAVTIASFGKNRDQAPLEFPWLSEYVSA